LNGIGAIREEDIRAGLIAAQIETGEAGAGSGKRSTNPDYQICFRA
jgi:hypothetical protein